MAEGKPWFPMFVDLSEKHILFVGGGAIAARRARVILPFAGRVTVVAPALAEALRPLAEAGEIAWRPRAYRPEDLDGADIALACTDDPALNAAVHAACAARGIPCNVCSDHGLCDFYFPGIVRRGQMVVGVNAGGSDHRRARRLRERIEAMLDATPDNERDPGR